jgi:hypothetical protein
VAAFVRSNNVAVSNVAGTTGITITKPASVETGDVLFCFLSRADDTGVNFTSSGWVDVTTPTDTSAGNDLHCQLMSRTVTDAGTEAANYTFVNDAADADGMTAVIVAVALADLAHGNPWHVVNQATGAGDATPAAVAVTTTVADCLILTCLGLSMDSGVSKTDADGPTDTTSINFTQEAGGALESLASMASQFIGTPGASTTNVWQTSADDATSEFHTHTCAVRSSEATRPYGQPTSYRPLLAH